MINDRWQNLRCCITFKGLLQNIWIKVFSQWFPKMDHRAEIKPRTTNSLGYAVVNTPNKSNTQGTAESTDRRIEEWTGGYMDGEMESQTDWQIDGETLSWTDKIWSYVKCTVSQKQTKSNGVEKRPKNSTHEKLSQGTHCNISYQKIALKVENVTKKVDLRTIWWSSLP